MANMLETPSRIWRRIGEAENDDMPSLPSISRFEDSQDVPQVSSEAPVPSDDSDDLSAIESPIHSTPAVSSHYGSVLRSRSNSASASKFANSIARSGRSSATQTVSQHRSHHADSFDISSIPSLPDARARRSRRNSDESEIDMSVESVPDVYLPPREEEDGDDDDSLTDALKSVGHISMPLTDSGDPTPRKQLEYFVTKRGEKPTHSSHLSPFQKFKNAGLRRPNSRTRTPSLSRTASSSASSSVHTTPESDRSVSLDLPDISAPFSPSAAVHSPPAFPDDEQPPLDTSARESDTKSMDITDAHISPLRDFQSEENGETHPPEGQADERDPTFSSDGDQTAYPHLRSGGSSILTPTPAFHRARFNTVSDDIATPAQHRDSDREELLTPYTSRRSFLLSLIHSTAKPRMKAGTPHPRQMIPDSPSTEDSEATPVPARPAPSINLQNAFAGVTPRPRITRVAGRLSHPLAQMHSAPEESESDQASPSGTWATPAAQRASPYYDGTVDRASFISTASSHDLTTHHRVNTSFDPAMGFAAGAQAVGRFNAPKLNNYLHGLNRQLQRENETLTERLRSLEEKATSVVGESSSGSGASRRVSGVSRRVSGRPSLGGVQEDAGGEGWMEEKAELEEIIEALRSEVAEQADAKSGLEKALKDERDGRAEDDERFKERMAEVHKRIEPMVQDLARQVDAGKEREEAVERALKDLEQKASKLEGERDDALERAHHAERALEGGQQYGEELKSANEKLSQVMSQLRASQAEVEQFREAAARFEQTEAELERELRDEQALALDLQKELDGKMDDVQVQQERVQQLEEIVQAVREELESTNQYVTELEEGAEADVERVATLEAALLEARDRIQQKEVEDEATNDQLSRLQSEAAHATEEAALVKEALEEAEEKLAGNQGQISDLQSKVAMLERERERIIDHSSGLPHTSPSDAEIDALEDEIVEANREIARLNAILNQSPARKAIDKAKDTKLEILEKENEELHERIKALRSTAHEFGTPGKVMNMSGISPMHRQVLAMNVRTPRTPGAPLKDLSWLHNTTMGDASTAPLVAEIARLQRELDRANESIDDKIDKLEDAGLGVVELTQKLEDARARITTLQNEIARLSRRDDRRTRRLERVRCRKCLTKIDFKSVVTSLDAEESSMNISVDRRPAEPPTPPTRTSEALRMDLQEVNANLDSMKQTWEAEKRRLLGEKAVLQDAANRLNIQAQDAKSTNENVKALSARNGVQRDLEKARLTIIELEGDLKGERARLRAMSTEQNRVQREKEEVLLQLQRTESDMDDIKGQLNQYKKQSHDLESELRANSKAEQKAHALELRAEENAETIGHLREERDLLSADYKSLQKRLSDLSEHASNLRDQYAASQNVHDNRRHELDLRQAEIDELRKALSTQAEELQRTTAEKDRVVSEKDDVAQTVAGLQHDLQRVKKDAEAFGRDLRLLRIEKEKLETKQQQDLAKTERLRKQHDTQVRLLNEQLDGQRDKARRIENEWKSHTCSAYDEEFIASLKLQHNKECKGLIVQIRYLKAKFSRESTLRFDLAYQKNYLLVLLARFERSEQTILAAISRIGFPVLPPLPQKRRKKLKSVVISVIFLRRLRLASAEWREHSASKQSIQAALLEVRRQRGQRA